LQSVARSKGLGLVVLRANTDRDIEASTSILLRADEVIE
jgi:hypothetical protein